MTLSLLLTTLFFALVSQGVSYAFRRSAPEHNSAIRASGLSSSLPILSTLLILLAYGLWPAMNPEGQMNFIWKAVSVISLTTMFGILIAGDAGRWERTDDQEMPGVKGVRLLGLGGWRRPIVFRRVFFAPKPQAVPVRRARQIMGFVAILFAMNAIAVLSNHAQGKRPLLAATPIVLMPSTLSTVIVERLEEPKGAEPVLAPAFRKPAQVPGVMI